MAKVLLVEDNAGIAEGIRMNLELEGHQARLAPTGEEGIKLLDRCAHDHPELAAVWYGTGRERVQELLRRYLEDRIRRRRLAPVEDPAVTARIVLETAVFWAVHRHWDPSPQAVDDQTAERAVVDFVVRALLNHPD